MKNNRPLKKFSLEFSETEDKKHNKIKLTITHMAPAEVIGVLTLELHKYIERTIKKSNGKKLPMPRIVEGL